MQEQRRLKESQEREKRDYDRQLLDRMREKEEMELQKQREIKSKMHHQKQLND